MSEFEVRNTARGDYEAAAGLSFGPAKFISEPADTKNGAKAKLMFEVLNYLEEVLGCRIIYLNNSLKEYLADQLINTINVSS